MFPAGRPGRGVVAAPGGPGYNAAAQRKRPVEASVLPRSDCRDDTDRAGPPGEVFEKAVTPNGLRTLFGSPGDRGVRFDAEGGFRPSAN
jgi:hypothetical protein